MKIYISIIALYIFPFLALAQSTPVYSTKKISALEQKANHARFSSASSSVVNNYDLKYHRCVWEIDPAVKYIKGAVTSYFKPTVNSFNKIQFDLSAVLTVDSVVYHTVVIGHVQLPGDLLEITFPSSIAMNTLDSLVVYYKGIPSSSGFGSFNQSTHGNNATPIIWTLSEPFGAKDWWPCKQNLNDKIDSVDVMVTTPQINRVASNGLLKSEILSGTNKIFHWKTKYPIAAYLIAISVTDYSYYSNYVPLVATNSVLEVLNYVYPENFALAQTQTTEIIKIISLYDSLTIAYPFAKEKYGHAQFGWGGGMEHQTMSFMTDFSQPLLAHECAHQWFGDHVTCGSWEDIWLNEGFATYFEGLTQERYFPATWESWKKSKISDITSLAGGSVLCDDTTNISRIFDGRLSYDKGAYLLHMLRWKLGDAVFFQALRNYLNDPALAGNYAKTPQLKAHLESASGLNLTNFFNQWYYGQGYPSYQVSCLQSGDMVSVTMNQKTSHASVLFFEMPVPIKFIGVDRDTTLVFDHSFSGQTFHATINFKAISVQFDPTHWILSSGNSISGIADNISDLIIYPNPGSHSFTLNLKLSGYLPTSVEITDRNGKAVLKKDFGNLQGDVKQSLEIPDLESGTYQLKVIHGDKKELRKIVVE
jgi:aminopeptidase N